MQPRLEIMLCLCLIVPFARINAQTTDNKTEHATYIRAEEIEAILQTAIKANAVEPIGPVLQGTNYTVNIRREVTGKAALTANMHPETVEIYVIRQGSGTLVTGGALESPRTVNNGDSVGSGVKGGERRLVKQGDVVLIPAGVPHWFANVAGSVTYLNIRFPAPRTGPR